MSVIAKVPSVFVPDLTKEVGPQTQRVIKQFAQQLQQHEQAFAILKSQQPAATTSTTAAATPAQSTPTSTVALALGTVNEQDGTAYTVQDSDYGGLIVLGNAQPVTLALNTACRQYWFGALQNLGPSIVTISPPSGNVNNQATVELAAGVGAWLFFDGTNWWAVMVGVQPQTQSSAAHEFLTSYNATTGAFTAAQVAFGDLSGSATPAQLPPVNELSGQITAEQLPVAGINATVTLAALTVTGQQGSMTFTDGILTAYTPPS